MDLKEITASAIININVNKTNKLKVVENKNQFIETKQITLIKNNLVFI
jgi:hypothetical protein